MEAKRLLNFSIIVLLVVSAASTAWGQNLEIPQKEFALSFSKDRLELSGGETGVLEVLILKSKECQRSNVKMSVSSVLPKGVVVSFSPEKGRLDSTKASISIQPDAAPGQYAVILSATLNYKTKGVILKLLIN